METVKFEELQLDDRILRAVTDMGFEEASPIQAEGHSGGAGGLRYHRPRPRPEPD